MALPVFRAAGARAADTTNAVAVTAPAGVATGDLEILVATTLQTGTVAITANGGSSWTAVTGTPVSSSNAAGEKLYIWYRIRAGGDSNPSVQATTDHVTAGRLAYQAGTFNISDPLEIEANGEENVSDTSFSWAPGTSTTVNDCLVLAVATSAFDQTSGQVPVMTNANLASLASRIDFGNAQGGGGGFGVTEGALATAGAVGTFACTYANASVKTYASFAIKPFSVTVYERDAALGATAAITSAGSVVAVYSRTAALSASASIASTGFVVTEHERTAALGATASIASAGAAITATLYPSPDLYPFGWETAEEAAGAVLVLPPSRLGSSLAAEIVVDPGETGFASFTEDAGPNGSGTQANDASVGTVAWVSPSKAATLNDDPTTADVGGDAGSQVQSGSCSNNAIPGNVTWQDASGANSSGGAYAWCSDGAGLPGLDFSDALELASLGFSIPGTATITGIKASVRRQAYVGTSAGRIVDYSVRLLKAGAVSGSNKASGADWPESATSATAALSTRDYGSSSDLWGTSWTPAQINGSGFGLQLIAVGGGSGIEVPIVDHMYLTVYYELPDKFSQYLKLTNFGLPVPDSAPKGIAVSVRRRSTVAGGISDENVKLVKGGAIGGDNRAGAATWRTSYDTVTYGGPSDLWGRTWTDADFGSTFGVAISVDGEDVDAIAQIDHVSATVYYEVAGTTVAITGSPLVRFTPDGPDPPTELSFQTEIPGGFSAGQITVARSENFIAERLVYGSARFFETESNRTVYEGRVVGIADDGEHVTFELEGWAAHLEDDHSAKMIWYDRDASAWQGMSVQRKLDLVTAGWGVNDGGVTPDATTGAAALELGIDGPWIDAALPVIESWYSANGISIDLIDWAWKRSSTIGADPGASVFEWKLALGEDDSDTGSSGTGNIHAAGPDAGTFNPGGTMGTWAFVQVELTAAGGLEGEHYSVFWTLLGVVGDHGLTLRGSVSAPATGRGLYVSDMIEYAVETWAPLLNIGEIEATDFAVPHAVDKEPTTAREMIEKYVIFGGGTFDYPIDWFVYDDRTFGTGTPGAYGRVWRTRYEPDGAEAAESGPDVQRLINGCVVQWDDGSGTTRTVGPPGSGADDEDTDLLDVSDANPANRTGARHWELFNAGITTLGGATQIGKMTLAERNRQEWRGEVRVKEWVLDEAGNEFPAAMIRAGDRLVIEDDDDTRERRIVSTSYDASTETVSCAIGASPDRLDTLLARLAVVLEGRLA